MKWRGARRWAAIVGLVALAGLAVFGATARAEKQRIGTDFHVFWQAGYDFSHRLVMYHPLPGARKFNYPPFAAQVFQVLSLFPLRTAAWLFYLLSVGLIVVAAAVSRDIITRLEPDRPIGRLPLILALACSLNFLLSNLNMVQVNLLIFVMCLLGVRGVIDRRDWTAAGWIVAATAIKLTPLFFVMWLLIRGTRRTWAAVALAGGLCLVLPIIQRGWHQGWADLSLYYRTFLQAYAAGTVIPDYTNQNLASLIYRAVVPLASNDPAYDYVYLPSLHSAAPLLYRIATSLVLVIFLVHLLRLRLTRRPVTALESASVFLTSHLLSAITWKAHLVTLLFIGYAFFALDRRRLGPGWQIALAFAAAGLVAIGLGRDVLGSRLHHYVGGYSLIVWVMLLLFALSVLWTQREELGQGVPVSSGAAG